MFVCLWLCLQVCAPHTCPVRRRHQIPGTAVTDGSESEFTVWILGTESASSGSVLSHWDISEPQGYVYIILLIPILFKRLTCCQEQTRPQAWISTMDATVRRINSAILIKSWWNFSAPCVYTIQPCMPRSFPGFLDLFFFYIFLCRLMTITSLLIDCSASVLIP